MTSAELNALNQIKEIEQTESFRGYKIAELREVFDRNQNQQNWKNGNTVEVHHTEVCKLDAAVAYFLADKTTIWQNPDNTILMSWNGYQG